MVLAVLDSYSFTMKHLHVPPATVHFLASMNSYLFLRMLDGR